MAFVALAGGKRRIDDPPARNGTGIITGVVLFTGKVPPDQKIEATDGTTIVHNDLVVDRKSNGLRYVAVVLENAPVQPKLTRAQPVVMDQKDMVFVPRVLAVQHGRPVVFTNSDLCNHGVMSVTTVAANQFNVLTPVGNPFKFVFQPQPRPVRIGCSLHSWMKGWVYVLQRPWFDVTDAQGKFALREIPAGKYTIWLHHPDTGKHERRPVEVKAGASVNWRVQWASAGK
jgi:plastocyanin